MFDDRDLPNLAVCGPRKCKTDCLIQNDFDKPNCLRACWKEEMKLNFTRLGARITLGNEATKHISIFIVRKVVAHACSPTELLSNAASIRATKVVVLEILM